MPRLQDIENFKNILKNMGDEPAVLEQWGETYEEPIAPEKSHVPLAVSDDISELLDGLAMDDSLDASLDLLVNEEIEETESTEDFTAFLDDLDLESLPGDPAEEDPSESVDIPEALASDDSPAVDEFPGAEEPLEASEPVFDDLPIEPVFETGAEIADMGEISDMAEISEIGDTGDTSDIPDIPDIETALEPADAAIESFDLPDMDFGMMPEEPDSVQPLAGEPKEEPEEFSFPDMESDAFESFDLGGETEIGAQDNLVPDLDASAFTPEDDLDGQIAALDSEGSASADTFSLDSGWGDFSIPGFETVKPDKKPAKPSFVSRMDSAGHRDQTQKARDVNLTEAQVDRLQDTLLSYPLNLRLCIEDIIANEKGNEAQQSDLIWMLVEDASARDAAKLAGKVLKRYIPVPSGYEKRTGAALEAEKGSFAWLWRHSIFPMLKTVALASVVMGILFFFGYNFGYKPIKANSLYKEGHRQIYQSKYAEAENFFVRADRYWVMKSWYYQYARAYAEMAQYPRSELSYERLLGRWPKETKAAIEYARMESLDLLAFEKAENILAKRVFNHDYFNKNALALMVDNYLAWADFEEQKRIPPPKDFIAGLYENARYYLATLMNKHGSSIQYIERMLLYFMRVERSQGIDKLSEIEPLLKHFINIKKSSFSAPTLAELGEYLMDRDMTELVEPILIAAVDSDGRYPEAHVAMARWNQRTGFPEQERYALKNAVRFFSEADEKRGLSSRRLRTYIQSLNRLAESQMKSGEFLDAEESLNLAISRYERGLEELRFNREAGMGKAYSLLAGIYYLNRRDFDNALSLYATAEKNGYTSQDSDYRRGYMWYYNGKGDGSEALSFFYRAGLDTDPSPWLEFATGNALYTRGDYFAAQGYFSMLADRMQFELDTISIPSPQAKPSHREIVELLIMARNNLGASLYQISERLGDTRRRSDAMVQFTESARLFDSISRDQTSMIRSESKNLGFLNLDFVLHPLRGIDIATYRELPVDMDYPGNY